MVKFVVKRKTTYPHFRLKSLLKTFICNDNYCILFYNTSVLVFVFYVSMSLFLGRTITTFVMFYQHMYTYSLHFINIQYIICIKYKGLHFFKVGLREISVRRELKHYFLCPGETSTTVRASPTETESSDREKSKPV